MNKQCKSLLILTLVAYIITVVVLVFNVNDTVIVGGTTISSYADNLIMWIIVYALIFGGIAACIGLAYTSDEKSEELGLDCEAFRQF